MVKRAGQGSDNIEAQFFPECEGDVIAGGDEAGAARWRAAR